MSKKEQLQKDVVDTKASLDTAYDAADVATDAAWYAGDLAFRAHASWSKAKLELEDYLKEQQDNG